MYKLLIVDDEEIERRAIENIIKKSSIDISEIAQAANGQEAVAVASTFEPNIIIMDITMPGLNGIKAAHIIKKFLPESHIIFLTAFDEFDYAKDAIKLGADDFLVKPASPDTIEGTINNSIRNIENKKIQMQKTQLTQEKLTGASKYLEECLVEALIDGESDEGKIEKYLSFTNIEFRYSFGAILTINIDEAEAYSDTSLEIKKEMIIGKIKKELETSFEKSIIYTEYPFLYVFIYSQDYSSLTEVLAELDNALIEIKQKIHTENKVTIEYGIGEICSNKSSIWKSFMQAKEIVMNKKEVNINKISTDIISDLAASIINDDKHSEKTLLKQVHSILESKCKTIDDYKMALFEFSISLKHFVVNKLGKTISVDDSLYLVASKIKNIGEGKDFMEYYAEKLRILCSIDEQDKNAIIVNQLAMYIEEHISENITLENLAEISKLSSFYICKLFKKYLKMNFIDYVTFVRIKNAKKLLEDPYLSIKEISFKSGYADPNYFARVFKKETGISPSIYRKQNITNV
ncbi:MAG: response regulator [Eubacteriales bacterium]